MNVNPIIEKFKSEKHYFERFMNAVVDFFELEPILHTHGNPIIHTIKKE